MSTPQLGLLISLLELHERDGDIRTSWGGSRSTLSLRKGGLSPRQIVRPTSVAAATVGDLAGCPARLVCCELEWLASWLVVCGCEALGGHLREGQGAGGKSGTQKEKSLRVAHHDQSASLSPPVFVSGYTRIKKHLVNFNP
jgi:hypothetical protein